jgi:prepilin-type N-terminal cleavage/methylation domain-containing protein
MKKNKGFTLVELLVVVSIITLLSSVALASTAAFKDKANVASYVQSLKQFQTALEVYRNDKGYYPLYDANTAISTRNGNNGGGVAILMDSELPDFIPKYLPTSPMPFNNDTANYQIAYYNNIATKNLANAAFTCQGQVLKGYVILFTSNIFNSSSTPKLWVSGSASAGWWCLTAPN